MKRFQLPDNVDALIGELRGAISSKDQLRTLAILNRLERMYGSHGVDVAQSYKKLAQRTFPKWDALRRGMFEEFEMKWIFEKDPEQEPIDNPCQLVPGGNLAQQTWDLGSVSLYADEIELFNGRDQQLIFAGVSFSLELIESYAEIWKASSDYYDVMKLSWTIQTAREPHFTLSPSRQFQFVLKLLKRALCSFHLNLPPTMNQLPETHQVQALCAITELYKIAGSMPEGYSREEQNRFTQAQALVSLLRYALSAVLVDFSGGVRTVSAIHAGVAELRLLGIKALTADSDIALAQNAEVLDEQGREFSPSRYEKEDLGRRWTAHVARTQVEKMTGSIREWEPDDGSI